MSKTTTFSEEFTRLRAGTNLTMLGIAEKCSISESTVWKVEHGESVRWETVHLILVVALKIGEDSPLYESLHRLWLKQRQEKAKRITPQSNNKTLSKEATEATRKFRILIRNMGKVEMDKVMAAATMAAKRLQQ